MNPDKDFLIMWKDGTKDVVKTKDIENTDEGKAIFESAQVPIEKNESCDGGNISSSDCSDEDNDLPLAELQRRIKTNLHKHLETGRGTNTSVARPKRKLPEWLVKTAQYNSVIATGNEGNIIHEQVAIEENERGDGENISYSDCSDNDNEFPLAELQRRTKPSLTNLPKQSKTVKVTTTSVAGPKRKLPEWLVKTAQNTCNSVIADGNEGDIWHEQACEFEQCCGEVFSACHRCNCLLCYDHFVDNDECSFHTNDQIDFIPCPVQSQIPRPEDFCMDGALPEIPAEPYKRRRTKKENAKMLRDHGNEYTSPATGKSVASKRKLSGRCNGNACRKQGRKCDSFSEKQREKILNDFYDTGSLQLQREFISRFVEIIEKKKHTASSEKSRRSNTYVYYLPSTNNKIKVCKKMFLSTLNCSEKAMRTAVSKTQQTGVLEKENRGGRVETLKSRDKKKRDSVQEHINKFPRVESHYCRQNTKRVYVSSQLNTAKMHDMYIREQEETVSYSTYQRVKNENNISFHRPKKDQCGLCMIFAKSAENQEQQLREKYSKHIKEKNTVREKKEFCKKQSQTDPEYATAVFDLQQVIYLPISNQSSLFYKRRLSNYNLTMYNLANKECKCYLWHEGVSKRGSCEVATCVYRFLKEEDSKGKHHVVFFCDGCPGQNKNTVMAGALLYAVVTLTNITSIELNFFEAYHGQNEGDSSHSAISNAIKRAGDMSVPSQLPPVLRMARRNQPYVVERLNTDDILGFKKLSQEMRILNVKFDDNGNKVEWLEVRTIRVDKTLPNKLLYKTSHMQTEFNGISLKSRTAVNQMRIGRLNVEPPKISKEKYQDLLSLCSGNTPVVTDPDEVNFYKTLPHED